MSLREKFLKKSTGGKDEGGEAGGLTREEKKEKKDKASQKKIKHRRYALKTFYNFSVKSPHDILNCGNFTEKIPIKEIQFAYSQLVANCKF